MEFKMKESEGKQTLVELFLIYVMQTITSVLIYSLFVGTSLLLTYLSRYAGGLGILTRLVAWTVSVTGTICCVAFIFRNTLVFLNSIMKAYPKDLMKNIIKKVLKNEKVI